mgnify:CR=1 FL=1
MSSANPKVGFVSLGCPKALVDSERIDIDSDRIRNDPALLADEASALSLFGDKRHIRLNFRREEGLAAVENLLSLEGDANPVIATAGNLTKASKLRKLAEARVKMIGLAALDGAAAGDDEGGGRSGSDEQGAEVHGLSVPWKISVQADIIHQPAGQRAAVVAPVCTQHHQHPRVPGRSARQSGVHGRG